MPILLCGAVRYDEIGLLLWKAAGKKLVRFRRGLKKRKIRERQGRGSVSSEEQKLI